MVDDELYTQRWSPGTPRDFQFSHVTQKSTCSLVMYNVPKITRSLDHNMRCFCRNTVYLDHNTCTVTCKDAHLKRIPGQPHFTMASQGQLDQLPRVRRPLPKQLDPPASTGYLLTNAMPTLRWLPTSNAPEPSPWLCFWLRELVPLPSHGHEYSSATANPTSPAGLPSIRLDCLDAVLPRQDPTPSPKSARAHLSC